MGESADEGTFAPVADDRFFELLAPGAAGPRRGEERDAVGAERHQHANADLGGELGDRRVGGRRSGEQLEFACSGSANRSPRAVRHRSWTRAPEHRCRAARPQLCRRERRGGHRLWNLKLADDDRRASAAAAAACSGASSSLAPGTTRMRSDPTPRPIRAQCRSLCLCAEVDVVNVDADLRSGSCTDHIVVDRRSPRQFIIATAPAAEVSAIRPGWHLAAAHRAARAIAARQAQVFLRIRQLLDHRGADDDDARQACETARVIATSMATPTTKTWSRVVCGTGRRPSTVWKPARGRVRTHVGLVRGAAARRRSCHEVSRRLAEAREATSSEIQNIEAVEVSAIEAIDATAQGDFLAAVGLRRHATLAAAAAALSYKSSPPPPACAPGVATRWPQPQYSCCGRQAVTATATAPTLAATVHRRSPRPPADPPPTCPCSDCSKKCPC